MGGQPPGHSIPRTPRGHGRPAAPIQGRLPRTDDIDMAAARGAGSNAPARARDALVVRVGIPGRYSVVVVVLAMGCFLLWSPEGRFPSEVDPV